jgi:drug/metabolite transporter (DMT)-like permease
MPTNRRLTPAVWLALLTLYVVWGSTYLGIRFAIETIPPYVMSAARFLIAGGLILGIAIVSNPRAPRPTLRQVRDSVIVGTLLLGGGMGLVAWGEQTVPSSIAALLIALLPAWLAVLGRIFVGERIGRWVSVGIVIGVAGVAVLVGPWQAGGSLDPAGVAAILLSPVLWAAGSVFAAHRATQHPDPLRSTGIQMLGGSAVLAVVAVLSGELAGFEPSAVSTTSLAGLAYLILVGSLVGYTTYVWILGRAPLATVGTYAFVNPVVAVILGALIGGETIGPRVLVAGSMIVVAVALIVIARGRPARAAQPAPSVVPPDELPPRDGRVPRPAGAASAE